MGRRARRARATQDPTPAQDVADPEAWERRNRKRRQATVGIKNKHEHWCKTVLSDSGFEDLPQTPDPDSPAPSKREWEASVMEWRAALKRLVPLVSNSD